jgi:hypothetical protein
MGLFFAAMVAVSYRPAFAASATPNMGVVIPLYTYPTDGTWSQVIQAKQAYPNVPFIAIINPDSGPGPSQDANYVQGIKNMQAAGVTVLGYVDTAYGGDSISSVEANVNLYHTWYNVDGILFDDMTNQVGYETYYSTLGSYVHSLGMAKSMGNPGTSVPTSFIGTLDTLCIYESNGLPSLSFITYAGYAPSDFAMIALGVPLSTTFLTSASGLISWVYLTDASGSNPYDALPSYFTSEVATLSTIDGTTVTTTTSTTSATTSSSTTSTTGTSVTVSVNSVNLTGSAFSGMWTTLNQGSTVLATGYTPTSFAGTTGGVYTLIVANYDNYVFCHWQDGSTDSSRTLTLSGNLALKAYYSTTGSCPSAPATYTVNLQSDYLNGASLTGMYATVTSGGSNVATGYTPLSFTGDSGSSYTITASNGGSLVFDHWSTSSPSNSITFTPSADTTLTAYYRSPVTLTVNSANTAGGSITGVSANVASGSTTIASGATPLSASIMTGTNYAVTVTAPAGWVFAHWQDGTTNPTKSISVTQGTTLTASFAKQSAKVSVTVVSKDLSGRTFTGMWLQVTSKGKVVASGYTTLTFTVTVGTTYIVSVSNWQNYVFAHWDNGSTNPVRSITPTQATTLQAYYNT